MFAHLGNKPNVVCVTITTYPRIVFAGRVVKKNVGPTYLKFKCPLATLCVKEYICAKYEVHPSMARCSQHNHDYSIMVSSSCSIIIDVHKFNSFVR